MHDIVALIQCKQLESFLMEDKNDLIFSCIVDIMVADTMVLRITREPEAFDDDVIICKI